MKRVLTAVIMVPVVLLLVLRAPQPIFAGALLVLNFLAQREFLAFADTLGILPHRRLALLAGLWLVLAFSLPLGNAAVAAARAWPSAAPLVLFLAPLFDPFAILLIIVVAVLLSALLRGARLPQLVPDTGFTLIAALYPALFLALVGQLRLNYGAWWVLFLLLVVWLGDVAAYYVGRTWGRHRLAPRISPAKSWEGLAASLAAALAVAALLARFAPQVTLALLRLNLGYYAFMHSFPLLPMLFLALALNLAAQAGDLVESAFKRAAGVKDSSSMLPGHGGLLDRMDAMLLAIPVLWYYLFLHG